MSCMSVLKSEADFRPEDRTDHRSGVNEPESRDDGEMETPAHAFHFSHILLICGVNDKQISVNV